MPKRIGSFSNNLNSKRQKTDENEDLWGDDFDENAIDDCIKFETQCLSQYTQGSLLPSYNSFLKPNGLLSSTQFSQARPSSSTKNSTTSNEFEKQVTKLKEQVAEKNGEVVYLRGEIRKLESTLEVQQKKTEQQWKEKLYLTETDLKSVKSDLEFKNLEIANLKQRISDIQKQKYLEQANLTQVHAMSFTKHKLESNSNEISKKQPILETLYPLKTELSHEIYQKDDENCVFEQYNKVCRNPMPSLQNQISKNERSFGNKFKSFLSNKKELRFDYIHADVFKLTNCTQQELNSHDIVPHINKIVCVSLQLMLDFHHYLKNISNSIQVEGIQKSDTYYLEHRSFDFDNEECGVNVTKCLNVVAQLILSNEYLQDYVCRKKALKFCDKGQYIEDIPFLKEYQYNEPFYFLNLLYKNVSLIGQIRKSHVTSNFLSVVVKLLINVCKVNLYEDVSTIFCEIVKELIFARPKLSVVQDLCVLLKVASHYNSFMVYLMTKPNNSKVKRDTKKGIIQFKKDSCRLYMFVVLFDNTLYRIANEEFKWTVCLNLLSFIYNSYKYSFASHYCTVKSCECLPQLNKLIVEVIFKAIKKFDEEKECVSENCKIFFRSKMMQNMIYLMSFTSYENIAKYISVYSQFKEIENCLLNEEELAEFEKLNLSEEIPELEATSFENIDFL